MGESDWPINVGITGPRGFIATHLARYLAQASGGRIGELAGRRLEQRAGSVLAGREIGILPCARETLADPCALVECVDRCDTLVHLAGMAHGNDRQIYDNNVGLIDKLIAALESTRRRPQLIFPSSLQRDRVNAYGRSTKYAEDRLREWAARAGAPLAILIVPDVYGPGCRPYHNSVVATFCHQLAHEQQPVVFGDEVHELVWINDLVEAIGQVIVTRRMGVHEARINGTARIRTSELLAKLQAIRDSHFSGQVVPDLSDPFDATLYTTFFSSIDAHQQSRRANLHNDARGQLFEVMRLAGGGQIFFAATKPGVIRGNHFHSRKVERFCVVRGEAIIRIRLVGDEKVREFRVSGSAPEFISVPALCTHQIENVGEEDLLTMFWSNEIFKPGDTDTFFEKVA